ncbi:MAG: S41 family peptidase [Bacteroidales bacterium]|jgi:carboxyl-terminal processing protease|nr:S41 family peptidase [Bacteroidales bacterium]
MKKNKFKIALITIATIVPLLFLSFVNSDFDIAKNIDIFSNVIKELHVNYVDEINTNDLVKSAIDNMLEELDPYTVFYPESDIEEYRLLTTGQYGGIGAIIQQKDDFVMIVEPYEGSPSHKAGILPGDIILEVNDKSAKGKTTSEVSSILKGQPGTTVKLKIMPYGENKAVVKEIEREEIKLPNIEWSGLVDDKIGYVRLSQFTENAAKELKEEFLKLKDENIEGFILDLRGNGGGLLHEAVLIMNIFVDRDNLITYTRGKTKDRNVEYKTTFTAVDTETPVVVLVDRASASASEIVAGSMQDLDRGVIIGERTFGKGLVQNVIPLPYNSRLKVTISKYFIPSGRCIQAIDYSSKERKKLNDSTYVAYKTKNGRTVYDKGGIEPDIELTNPTFSKIASSLYAKNVIFDFANQFYKENEKITEAAQFKISDKIFNDFKNFIKDKDYDYETETESLLKRLKNSAEEEKYLSEIESEIKALEKKLQHNKDDDINTFKGDIVEMLQAEIVSRYYHRKGQIEVTLQNDIQVKKAVEIIKDKKQYNEILSPKK